MNATKTVYICRNLDNGQTLYNKVMGIWNDGSKPHLNGSKAWTFAIKKAGLDSPTIIKAAEHLKKLGFKNIQFEKAEVDKVTNVLVVKELLALPEYTGDFLLPAIPYVPEALEAPVKKTARKRASRKTTKKAA